MHPRNQACQSLCAFLFAILPFETLSAQDPPRPDLVSFAHGVLPVSIHTGDAALGTKMPEAIAVIDGNPASFVLTPKPGAPSDVLEILYSLPAPTRFDRFAVPNVSETPSPSQTFFSHIDVLGSDTSADGPFLPLASGELAPHAEAGAETELILAADQPEVLWIKLLLRGGVNVERDKTFFEFSELIGNGAQQAAALSQRFNGVWKGRGVAIELAQEGASVTGCYDKTSLLTGTVEGNVLRALGKNAGGIPSQFIVVAAEDGSLRGLRSTNGAPFKPYDGEASNSTPVCLPAKPAPLGCGAIVHGIGFDYDSDVIRSESGTILSNIYESLKQVAGVQIEIIGHSSSEGSAEYNRDLSRRRAAAVVTALVDRGLNALLISASGRGEDEPIASNDDEAGRSLNRRVEIQCAE